MKKFFAGIVMSALLFMALAVPAFASNSQNNRSTWTNNPNKQDSNGYNGSCNSSYNWYYSC